MEGKVPKGKILVKVRDAAKVTKGGIHIPNTNKLQKEAEVVIGGEEVKVGDVIIYTKDGIDLVIEDEKYLLLREFDVCYIK